MNKILRVSLPVMVLAVLAPGPEALASSDGNLGIGLYQGTDLRSFQMYPTFFGRVTEAVVLQGGMNLSTEENFTYGFLFRGAYAFRQEGSTNLNLGGMLEIFDRGTNHLAFGILVGVEQVIAGDFSVILDAYPFAVTGNGDTEVTFLEGRFGASWWF